MKYNIGKGKYFSIAKAGLILYFEHPIYKGHFLDWGEIMYKNKKFLKKSLKQKLYILCNAITENLSNEKLF